MLDSCFKYEGPLYSRRKIGGLKIFGFKINIKECFNIRIPKMEKVSCEAVRSLSWDIFKPGCENCGDTVEGVPPMVGRFDKLASKILLNCKNICI